VGMDHRLVRHEPCIRDGASLLRAGQFTRRRDGGQLRPCPAPNGHSAQGGQGRFVPVCAQLLPALPSCGAPRADDRQRHEPYRIPLCIAPGVGAERTTCSRALEAGAGKPNVVAIWGDDIGLINRSCYSMRLDGSSNAQQSSDCARGSAVHRPLRRARPRDGPLLVPTIAETRVTVAESSWPGVTHGCPVEFRTPWIGNPIP
jgi:hypothetical protein